MAEAAKKTEEAKPESGKELEVKKAAPLGRWGAMDEMERQMERFFESVFPTGWLRPFRWERPMLGALEEWRPAVDVVDRDDEVVVRAEIPGVDKDDLDVSMSDSTVTIKGTTKREEKEEKGDYFRCETARGSFMRTVTLPAEIDTGKAEAAYKDGVLTLKLPKAETSKRRRIKIK